MISVSYVRQKEALGLGHAILAARDRAWQQAAMDIRRAVSGSRQTLRHAIAPALLDEVLVPLTLEGPPALPDSLGATASGSGYVIVTKDPVQVLHDLTGWALAEGVELVDLTVSKPSLEDVYLQLTGGIAGTE